MPEFKRAAIVIAQEHMSSGNAHAHVLADDTEDTILFGVKLAASSGDIQPTHHGCEWSVGTGLFSQLSGVFASGNGTYDSHFYDTADTSFSGVLTILNLERIGTGEGLDRFSPHNVSGLILWYDADQETGFSNNGHVTTIQDFSFSSNDATQRTNARKPRWQASALSGSKPSFRFDGNNDSMTFSSEISLTNYTFIFAGICQTMNNNALIGLFNANASNIGWATDTRTRLRISGVNQSNAFLGQRQFTSGNQHIYAERRRRGSSGLIEAYIDNVPLNNSRGEGDGAHSKSSGTHRQSNITMTTLGIDGDNAGQNFHGDLGDLIIYNKRISPRDLRHIFQYLKKKYNIKKS